MKARAGCGTRPVKLVRMTEAEIHELEARVWHETYERLAAVNEERVGFIVWRRPVPEWNPRQCIACGAQVARSQSEVCPHE